MINKIPYTLYFGPSDVLCSKGNAVEFIQPWYTPISTTPENTGMAVGGIGNTFTLTPQGKTPNFSFIPGIFIDCQEDDIYFNDFYISVMDEHHVENLDIPDFSEAKLYLNYYPAIFLREASQCKNKDELLSLIRETILFGQFYLINKEHFLRWNIEFSAATQQAIQADETSVETQLLVAIDFFNGLLVNGSTHAWSLTPQRGAVVPSVDASRVHYRALYPLAEYDYHGLGDIELTRQVVSPVIKDAPELCSLPLHWNQFQLTNRSNKAQWVTVVQPLNNLMGATYQKARDGVQDSCCHLVQNPIGHQHEPIVLDQGETQFSGVRLASNSPYASDIEGEVIYGVQASASTVQAGKITVSLKSQVYASKAQQQVWRALHTGRTNDHFDRGIYSGREPLSALVCVQVKLEPGETQSLRFAQVMDHSKILLDGWQSHKAYARYFPEPSRAETILTQTLPKLSEIEQRIVTQQQGFYDQAVAKFSGQESAQRYATMAMNSLSFLAESTVWDVEDTLLVKECVDYPFFNSLDVYFYGSFSLLYLLPQLDGAVMKHFARAILASDATLRRYWEYEDKPYAELVDEKYQGTRAERGAVIHDLGSPYDIQPDAYSWHNVKEWKDLAPKYILMVYRHWQKTGDQAVVEQCWPAVKESIEYLSQLIGPGEDLPLTRGTDDTFDNLSSHGISIYCGSLWAAGLRAAAELAQCVGETALSEGYNERSERALATLERALWDEKQGYYHFFVTPVQAKHLTGEGLAELQGLGLAVSGDAVSDAAVLNAYLDEVDEASDDGQRAQRKVKKQQLLSRAPAAFTSQFAELVEDSDNSFGDALLADSYLQLVGLPRLFAPQRTERTLDFIYQTNFVANSPKLGVANMTLADGRPHEAFQAQDVWIGVQFSVATALRLAGKQTQAETLMDTVYQALYQMAKIPFAAPEGFNCSVVVTPESMAQRFDIGKTRAQQWVSHLQHLGHLLSDGRVNPNLTDDADEFIRSLASDEFAAKDNWPDHAELHKWLLSTGLKYTAGRYFRPGMIFAYLYQ
ncbi:glucosylceramidase [Vibrio cholerae]